jgi:hypothetical protein
MVNKILLLSVSIICTALNANAVEDVVLREGYTLKLVTGNVRNIEGKWTFVTDEDITDGIKTLSAGSSIEMLKSSTLERILSSLNKDHSKKLRIQGTLTKYNGKNYLFPSAFIPLAPTSRITEKTNAESTEKPVTEPEKEYETVNTISETEEKSTGETTAEETESQPVLSDEVRNLLEGDWTPDFNRNRSSENISDTADITEPKSNEPEPQENDSTTKNTGVSEEEYALEPIRQAMKSVPSNDYNIVSKTGFVIVTGDIKSFRIDSLGRNVNNTSYILLPCRNLEWYEKVKYDIPGRRRYMVSGIVTEYEGRKYLLIQRLVRTYNNGNFAR